MNEQIPDKIEGDEVHEEARVVKKINHPITLKIGLRAMLMQVELS